MPSLSRGGRIYILYMFWNHLLFERICEKSETNQVLALMIYPLRVKDLGFCPQTVK